jgi:hypothetical protein
MFRPEYLKADAQRIVPRRSALQDRVIMASFGNDWVWQKGKTRDSLPQTTILVVKTILINSPD